jgi:hypothetical protein
MTAQCRISDTETDRRPSCTSGTQVWSSRPRVNGHAMSRRSVPGELTRCHFVENSIRWQALVNARDPYVCSLCSEPHETPHQNGEGYSADTGLALHFAGLGEPAGCHLENLVLNDLLAWRDVRLDRPEVLYWRTATGEEVDFVIEATSKLPPIELKATARPQVGDAKHLRTFREEYGRRSRPGLAHR